MQDLGWRWKEEPFHMLTGSPAFPYANPYRLPVSSFHFLPVYQFDYTFFPPV